MKPLISVVIPTYNRGPRLQATLDSVLAQTLSPATYEIIVVDDGSTDDTADFVCRTYGSNQRVRLIRQQNSGVAAARNRGLAEARGEFIAYLDHDDRWLPEKLELQLAAFDNQPAVGVVYCLWQEVDEAGVPLPAGQRQSPQANWKPATGRVFDWLCAPINPIISMSVPLLRTTAIRSVGGFDAKTAPCDDWDLWLRLARRYEFAYVPRVLVLYTRHAAQQSNDLSGMARAVQRTLLKQWSHLLTRPRTLATMVTHRFFVETVQLYLEAKAALATAQRARVLRLLGQVALRHPLALFSPQWLYLMLRFVTGRTASY